MIASLRYGDQYRHDVGLEYWILVLGPNADKRTWLLDLERVEVVKHVAFEVEGVKLRKLQRAHPDDEFQLNYVNDPMSKRMRSAFELVGARPRW